MMPVIGFIGNGGIGTDIIGGNILTGNTRRVDDNVGNALFDMILLVDGRGVGVVGLGAGVGIISCGNKVVSLGVGHKTGVGDCFGFLIVGRDDDNEDIDRRGDGFGDDNGGEDGSGFIVGDDLGNIIDPGGGGDIDINEDGGTSSSSTSSF